MSRYAAVDIGSNSLKLLIGSFGPDGRVASLHDEAVVTRLARGVDAAGRLHPESRARALAVLRGFVATCRAHDVTRIAAIGTSALRDAADRDEFINECAGFGLHVEVVGGDVEAQIVRLAAVRELPGLDPGAWVVDVGGGSAEVVWTGGRVSTELGVVRLTERHVAADPPGAETLEALRTAVRARLAALPLPRPAPALVASGSSGPLLARLHLGLATHDSARIHSTSLPLAAVTDMATRFATSTHAERLALPGMDASRADVALAGAVVLEQAAAAAGVDALVVNERSTRYGVFHRAFGPG